MCPDWESWDEVQQVDNAKVAMQQADKWLGVPQASPRTINTLVVSTYYILNKPLNHRGTGLTFQNVRDLNCYESGQHPSRSHMVPITLENIGVTLGICTDFILGFNFLEQPLEGNLLAYDIIGHVRIHHTNKAFRK